jgi:hypothetical protein
MDTHQARTESIQEEMKANQAKTDANLKELKAEMKADREEITGRLEAKIEANQAKMDVNPKEMKEEMLAKMEINQERMMACLGKMEATNLEANPEEIESVAVHEEVPKQETTVKSFGALKKWQRGQILAAWCRGKPKEWTQGKDECQ